MIPTEFIECGVKYWTFLQGKRGTPYPVTPTAQMIELYEIHSVKYREYVPGTSKKDKGFYLEPVNLEIFFDRAYVENYREKFASVHNVLSLLDKPSEIDLTVNFAKFEKETGLILSKTNPRHSLYIKFKEWVAK